MLIGRKTVQSLEEDSTEAEAASVFYATARNHVLADIKPPQATARSAALTEVNPPEFGFDHAYALPQDAIVVLGVDPTESSTQEWVVEGVALLTNATSVRVRYVADVDDALLDGTFAKALAAYLAHEVAYVLTENAGKILQMSRLYEMRMAAARAVYGMQSSTIQTGNDQLSVVR